jgi:peptide/nickel transport system permease protein
MLAYVVRRLLLTIPTLFLISITVFVIIQLPPGDFLTSYAAGLAARGDQVDPAQLESLARQYGLDQPLHVQYFKWISNVLRGDLGVSFEWNLPVSQLIWDKVGLTIGISLLALVISWLFAFPIAIYSATHQYSAGDYFFTILAFGSAAIPHFLIALVLMWLLFVHADFTLTGLFSSEYAEAPWSYAKFIDMLKHLAPAVFILGFLNSTGLVRTMRANLLDELNKAYVTTGRAKGLREFRLLLTYPVRIAIIPFVSTLGWTLPGLISGATVVSIVLSLPTTGPLLYQALMSQDVYLAGSFLLILSVFTVIGTFVSDILLALVDPRIRFDT